VRLRLQYRGAQLQITFVGASLSDDPEIAQFICTYIPSVWALELLLLLRREPWRSWAPCDLVKDDNLCRFERHGLAVKEGEGWHYAPANPLLDRAAAQLGEIYRERPMYTIGLIARPDPLRAFSDAFRIKKDET
jgi:hypothetical protein